MLPASMYTGTEPTLLPPSRMLSAIWYSVRACVTRAPGSATAADADAVPAPSPKSHVYVSGRGPTIGSIDLDASSVTGSGAVPDDGVAVSFATGPAGVVGGVVVTVVGG